MNGYDRVGIVADSTMLALPFPGGAATAIAGYRGSKLARNMGDAGCAVVKGVEHAHHIVAQGASKANAARTKLESLGGSVHDAYNGVALPKEFHQKMHTNEYYDMVNKASEEWESIDDAVDWLTKYADSLK